MQSKLLTLRSSLDALKTNCSAIPHWRSCDLPSFEQRRARLFPGMLFVLTDEDELDRLLKRVLDSCGGMETQHESALWVSLCSRTDLGLCLCELHPRLGHNQTHLGHSIACFNCLLVKIR